MYNAVFPTFGFDADFQVAVNNYTVTSSACLGHSVVFNLLDPVALSPYYNQSNPSINGSGDYGGFMGSYKGNCAKTGNEFNFEFSYQDTTNRRKMRDFMNWIPDGLLVTVRIYYNSPFNQSADLWKSDQAVYGVGNTLYDKLKQAGFAALDSFTSTKIWVFDYEKNNSLYVPGWAFSQGLTDMINYRRFVISADTLGFIT